MEKKPTSQQAVKTYTTSQMGDVSILLLPSSMHWRWRTGEDARPYLWGEEPLTQSTGPPVSITELKDLRLAKG